MNGEKVSSGAGNSKQGNAGGGVPFDPKKAATIAAVGVGLTSGISTAIAGGTNLDRFFGTSDVNVGLGERAGMGLISGGGAGAGMLIGGPLGAIIG